MADRLLLAAALLCTTCSLQAADATPVADADGYTRPLDSLRFTPHENQVVFEQATLGALVVQDPWEEVNRRIYHFNQRVDEKIMVPVVKGYRFLLPSPVRKRVSNFFGNIGDVTSLANSMLQLKATRSLQTTGRIVVNTTVGLAGLFDPATRFGLVRQQEDFGQTLGYYGVPAGPYVMLPVLGPSNLRDAGGRAADYAIGEQINYINVAENSDNYPVISVVKVVNEREVTEFRYGQLNSPFEYEKLRYVYSRSRELQVGD